MAWKLPNDQNAMGGVLGGGQDSLRDPENVALAKKWQGLPLSEIKE